MAAVYFGSPVLCLPVTTDQTMAAAALKDLGLAVVVPAADVTVPALREAMITLAGDRSFRERGRELAEDLHDRPLAPPDRLLVTLERIMRRTHARRLVKKDNGGLYLLQQANADVYLLLLLLLTCFMALLIVLVINILPIVINKRKVKAD
nr:UDP-glucuronosyltransferase 2A3-like [Procambarus clarkii]